MRSAEDTAKILVIPLVLILLSWDSRADPENNSTQDPLPRKEEFIQKQADHPYLIPKDAADPIMDEFALLEEQDLVVHTVSMREQSWYEAPASVTVITAQEIESLGAVNLAEVFRRVRGVHVIQEGANSFSINLRGIARLSNNRVLLLLDGRQFQDQYYGTQLWGALPIHPGDVERIEIIHGASSTLFGTNNMCGVVNIITKRAIKNPGFEGNAWGLINILSDPKDSRTDPALYNGGGAHLAYNWVNSKKTLGFRLGASLDLTPEWPAQAIDYFQGPAHYGLSFSSDYQPSSHWSLFASLQHSYSEIPLGGEGITSTSLLSAILQDAVTFQLEKKEFLSEHMTLKLEADARYFHFLQKIKDT